MQNLTVHLVEKELMELGPFGVERDNKIIIMNSWNNETYIKEKHGHYWETEMKCRFTCGGSKPEKPQNCS
ncbi:hypothetical protein C5167_003456 [Papaver somniferum]|uniref:Uncharacterized protein n=1 Tax=Papaver somniferum TaxID=3469 RepID=A0A4Y7L3L4_PAPSO|nr:hypothetical protein C5167_003456 [Papaver somniferum]